MVKEGIKKGHFSFITGSRECIGRNIAYIELQMLMAAIMYRYNLRVAKDFKVPNKERFNNNLGKVTVGIERRFPARVPE